MLRNRGEEDRPPKSSKLQAVFSKLSGVIPRAPELGSPKTMSSDIIESVLVDSPVPAPSSYHPDCPASPDERGLCLTVSSLTHRLEMELRSAKRTHLSCGEVLLPCGLLHRISRDILSMAESEPYGIKGCLIYINFEASDECRKLSNVKCDPGTATTFELNLTFKQHSTGWNFIPQFLKNLARGGTIVVSPAYVLSKRKLYRSIVE
ncbi:hypothetical protein MTP99_017822 [Tenebrio molitor]|jgi:hypothetical protein|uniref:protein charybde-like n=1 Tax=Tenebrio molitor TaxID=7067 RepID=UPI001C3BBBDC|nr:hypothetical protein MTP99_017822 [Tenebrio molitor]CAH1376434.1 unnamed protein product [Tenebrio molitor]